MNAFAPKHLGVGAPPPDNSVILKKTRFFVGDPAPGTPAHPGGQLASAGTSSTATPGMAASAPFDKLPRQSAALHFAPASYLALGREPRQAIFKARNME